MSENPSKFGWLIEKYINGELFYWDGHGSGEGTKNWTRTAAGAVRFTRHEDASIVLAWLCEGQGRAVEHGFVE